jgi:hypothetical protein
MAGSPKLSSDVTSKEATKLFKSPFSLLQLFGLVISMTNSYGHLSLRGDVFISYADCYFEPVCCV